MASNHQPGGFEHKRGRKSPHPLKIKVKGRRRGRSGKREEESYVLGEKGKRGTRGEVAAKLKLERNCTNLA